MLIFLVKCSLVDATPTTISSYGISAKLILPMIKIITYMNHNNNRFVIIIKLLNYNNYKLIIKIIIFDGNRHGYT